MSVKLLAGIDDTELEADVEFEFPKIFCFILGTPKHVPITKLHPNIPLINGTIILFLNPLE